MRPSPRLRPVQPLRPRPLGPVLLLVPLLLLTACAGTTPDTASPAPSPSSTQGQDDLAVGGGTSRAENDLMVEVDRGDGSPPLSWSLTCVGTSEGSHPDPVAACARLDRLGQPFAPTAPDIACTEIYGGPQTARISGLWRGEPVELPVARTDGCAISRWDALVPVVPAAS